MKNTILAMTLTIALCSCQKNIEQPPVKTKAVMTAEQQYNFGLYYGVTDGNQARGWFPPMWFDWRVGRLSMWLMFKQDSYGSSRADYAEFLFSDAFLSDIDSSDLVKKVDSSDNLAIKNYLTKNLLWKEQRYYTKSAETIDLKTWNYKVPEYLFKINGSNFPPYMKVNLIDKFMNDTIPLRVYDNTTDWYSFAVEGDDKNFGITADDPHRFSLFVYSDY